MTSSTLHQLAAKAPIRAKRDWCVERTCATKSYSLQSLQLFVRPSMINLEAGT